MGKINIQWNDATLTSMQMMSSLCVATTNKSNFKLEDKATMGTPKSIERSKIPV